VSFAQISCYGFVMNLVLASQCCEFVLCTLKTVNYSKVVKCWFLFIVRVRCVTDERCFYAIVNECVFKHFRCDDIVEQPPSFTEASFSVLTTMF